MEEGTTAAHWLTAQHVGYELSYGPGLMFSGVIASVQHLDQDWLSGEEPIAYPSPPRTLVQTTDGRSVSLAEFAPIYLMGALEGET